MAVNPFESIPSVMPPSLRQFQLRPAPGLLGSRSRLRFRYEPQSGVGAPPDPLRILRQGGSAFLAGLALALPVALVSIALAFVIAYCATVVLLLSFLGYWRETGRAIIDPGRLLVMISFTAVLAITSGVAAIVQLVG